MAKYSRAISNFTICKCYIFFGFRISVCRRNIRKNLTHRLAINTRRLEGQLVWKMENEEKITRVWIFKTFLFSIPSTTRVARFRFHLGALGCITINLRMMTIQVE